jgi:hypothetical protein
MDKTISANQSSTTPFELSPEEKAKITAEERYRIALRKELDPPKEKNKKWEFLNSTFGIWLFSSIVLGLITWGYTTWTDSRKAKEQKKEAINQIDVEITYRILDFETGLAKAQSFGGYASAVYVFLSPPAQSPQSISDKYSGINTRSLLIQLINLSDEDSKQQIRQALKGVNEISKIFVDHAKIRSDDSLPLSTDDIRIKEEIINIINSDIKISRWKTE